MSAPQRIARVRRSYNQWVANQTLEDYALRFTAKSARKWTARRVANTAFGAVSFLALEAIGGAITVNYGFTNAAAAIVVVGALIFLTGWPIAHYAVKYGVDIDLLTRGAGFGYIGSTITSLIYASFTFLFFAVEGAIMSLALQLCFGVPLTIGYIVSALVVIPLVTHGITLISRFQLVTQPVWIALHVLPFIAISIKEPGAFADWTSYKGAQSDGRFELALFGLASTVCFSLVAQIGEQVDFLRFMPAADRPSSRVRRLAMMAAGPGWIVGGAVKILLGSFLAFLAIQQMTPPERATEPTQMYLNAFRYVFNSPQAALAFTGAFVIVSQLKINVTNAYAGSIAWSNFFSRLTHRHPGRVVWLVFNVAIALMLMELGVYRALERSLGLYSIVAVAWVGALVADLVINKPLGLSPPGIEFKRAHLYDVNPVGVGAMALAAAIGVAAYAGLLGAGAQPFASFIALGVALVAAPAIAWATGGRYYLARAPEATARTTSTIQCVICEYPFEPEDMAHCPAYAGSICSLCCSLDARCHDLCKPKGRLTEQARAAARVVLPEAAFRRVDSNLGRYLAAMVVFNVVMAAILGLIYVQATLEPGVARQPIRDTLFAVFFIFLMVDGVAIWLFVLAQDSRRAAQDESNRQTALLMREIEAHKRTDIQLQKAKEAADAANRAKSRYVVSISHELRTPLNAILGYAQLLDRDARTEPSQAQAIRVVRRAAEHLSSLIDGLLDIARIEAGRFQLNRDEVALAPFLSQIVDMFRLQAEAKNLAFAYRADNLPAVVHTDEKQLRQILINLLSNAIKFTREGHVTLRVSYGGEVAEFAVEDTGVGISKEDIGRIFRPFERGAVAAGTGVGLGLTITKLLTKVMGGDLTVTSEPGRGTTFRFRTLLSRVAEPRPIAERDTIVAGYRGERRTILVADDDGDHRALMRATLEPLGFEVLTARDGESCLPLAAGAKPHLALLDLSMPGMSGWDVADRLRRLAEPPEAIVIVSANPPEQGDAAATGADAYLIKPVVLSQLLDTIGALLAIDWIHAEGSDTAPSLRAAALAQAGELPAPYIGDLIALGQIGYARGAFDKLREIEVNHPDKRAFVSLMRKLLSAYDLKSFVTLLEGVRRHDAA